MSRGEGKALLLNLCLVGAILSVGGGALAVQRHQRQVAAHWDQRERERQQIENWVDQRALKVVTAERARGGRWWERSRTRLWEDGILLTSASWSLPQQVEAESVFPH